MKSYIILALLSLAGWGLWGFFSKISTNYTTSFTAFILSNVPVIIIVPLLILYFRNRVDFQSGTGMLFAFLAGLAGAMGSLFFYLSLKHGAGTRIIPLTSLYPLISILLCIIILKEPVSIKSGLGIFFALLGVYFLSL